MPEINCHALPCVGVRVCWRSRTIIINIVLSTPVYFRLCSNSILLEELIKPFPNQKTKTKDANYPTRKACTLSKNL